MQGLEIKKIHYKGWPNCWRLSNGVVELVLTADMGPRIIRFGFCGDRNEFRELPAQLGNTGGRAWKMYGGHRLWHAPEDRQLSYVPDNEAIEVRPRGRGLVTVQKAEKKSGLRKELEVQLGAGGRVKVIHRLWNTSKKPVTRSPWALTVMDGGGRAIVPLPAYGPHPRYLQAIQHLVLWRFTEMADKRWIWGNKYVQLKQKAGGVRSQKVGFAGAGRWAAYLNRGHLFVKSFKPQPSLPYSDRGASTQIFTNSHMLELETLGPLLPILPGKAAVHVEEWRLFKGVPAVSTDADIDRVVLPRLKAAR